MRRALTILLVSTAALAADAHAQPPGETAARLDDAPAPLAPASYRRQLMLADGLAVGTVGAAVATAIWITAPDDFSPLIVGGFAYTSYWTTAPVIHFAHGHVWRGLLSGGARLLFPAIASATLTTALGYDESAHSERYGAAFGGGLAIGAVAAILLDWYVLTPSDEPVRQAPPVAPTISASAEHVFLGVSGSL